MNRIATSTLQQTMVAAMQRAQQQLAASETELATGRKAQDLAGLGTAAVPALSAHNMLAQQNAYAAVTTGLGTTLALHDANITSLDTLGSSLQQSLLTAVGTGDTAGLQDTIASAFGSMRNTLNVSVAGVPLFGGGQTSQPFIPQTLADAASTPASAAFANGDVIASARVADHTDLHYGVTASQLGSGLYAAFQTLAAAGPIGASPTVAQTASLKTAMDQIGTALTAVRTINAANGRNQAQVTSLTTRAQDRSTLLQGVISTNEEVDLSQVATQVAQQQTQLQASYSLFSKISGLSLLSYLPAG